METEIVSTVIWGIVWLVVGPMVGILLFVVGAAIGGAVGGKRDRFGRPADGIAVGGILGWILAVVWDIFVLIQVVLHIVRLIQLLTS